jgi:hypothetical protein
MEYPKKKCDVRTESGVARKAAPMQTRSNVTASEPSCVKRKKPRVPARSAARKLTHINDLRNLQSFQSKLLAENAEHKSQLAAAVADIVEKYAVIVKLAANIAKITG